MTFILDCDGVVWLGETAIPGSPTAVSRLREAGHRVVFLTNNSFPRLAEHVAKFERLGIEVDPGDVLTSPMAAASLLAPGERVMVFGGPGIFEALEQRGVEALEPGAGMNGESGAVDAVIVGFDRNFDFSRLATAATVVRQGARLVGTNDDATFPSSDGLLPGAGSLLAAVMTAGGKKAEVAGKPYDATRALISERVGHVDWVVGDRPSTDGALAQRLQTHFGLVLTGVTPPDHGPIDPAPDREAPDLAGLVEDLLA